MELDGKTIGNWNPQNKPETKTNVKQEKETVDTTKAIKALKSSVTSVLKALTEAEKAYCDIKDKQIGDYIISLQAAVNCTKRINVK
jgi:hypothetical protein